jgi:hypothetical protein
MVRAEIRGVSSTMMVRRGCPQGGVLSPFLWNLVINSLLGRLNTKSLWAQEFADGIAIVINGKFQITIYEFMQKALSIVQTWCREVGQEGSGLFYLERNCSCKNQVKYLAVILDEKLNRNSHIDHRMQKATIAFW